MVAPAQHSAKNTRYYSNLGSIRRRRISPICYRYAGLNYHRKLSYVCLPTQPLARRGWDRTSASVWSVGAASEIRLVRDRNAVVKQTLVVLGADFLMNARPRDPAIAVGGHPRLIEGVGIIHCESHPESRIVDQFPALHDVQLLCVRRAVVVQVGLVVQPDGVDDERIAFVTSD